ncbi:MAG: Bax inhibitor-1/YccA family protein [Verrucomicrobiota bacterium]
MRTGNPALNDKVFQVTDVQGHEERMTLNGTVNRAGCLILLVTASAWFSWSQSTTSSGMVTANPYMVIGLLGGFIVALITIFAKKAAAVTAPIYAVLEGLFLGGLSAIFEARFPGIAAQAVFATFGTLLGLLLAYRSGLIKATENFKLGVFAATAGIALLYLVSFVMGFFGKSIPMIHEATPIGIAFSVFVVIIAALNLVLDFDFIENGVRFGAPKYMEWYAAFGLLITLVWLYLEILRLLSKVRSR